MDLVALGVKFDQPGFFDKVLADLGSQDWSADAPASGFLGNPSAASMEFQAYWEQGLRQGRVRPA